MHDSIFIPKGQGGVIYGATGGDIATAHSTSAMQEQSTSNGITTWTTDVSAPQGFPQGNGAGNYSLVVDATASDGQKSSFPAGTVVIYPGIG